MILLVLLPCWFLSEAFGALWSRYWRHVVAVLGLAACMSACGCRNTEGATTAANVQRDIGHEAADLIRERCTGPVRAMSTQAEIDTIRKPCLAASEALRVLRTSHAVVVATIEAVHAGQCDATLGPMPAGCDLMGALLAMTEASVELGRALRAVAEGGE